MVRRFRDGTTPEYAAKMVESGFGAFPPEERVGLGLSLFVLAVDGLGWSDARILAHVKKGLDERKPTLVKLRQEGKFPKEALDPVEPATPKALTLADVKDEPTSKCEWCLAPESDPCHSKEARPGTWHPFRPRPEA